VGRLEIAPVVCGAGRGEDEGSLELAPVVRGHGTRGGRGEPGTWGGTWGGWISNQRRVGTLMRAGTLMQCGMRNGG
jgi:hypothetical protein